MSPKQKKRLVRITVSCLIFAGVFICERFTDFNKYTYLLLYLIPYFTAGYDVLLKSVKNISRGKVFDEAFLMSAATIGALIIGEYPESVFVMVFFQIGELFQSIAVGKSRRSIAALMDIRPEFACVIRDGAEIQVAPEEVAPGELLTVRPGEKIPLDGIVEDGISAIDTSALTGEATPVDVKKGSELVSGSINLSGLIKMRASRAYGESTVAKILELVENSSLNKAKSEQFLTRFAKYYTPAVVVCALLLALIPSLATGDATAWVYRALIFLVVSCPCALVISVPMSFFGGIGGASAKGVLVKGANYLEALGEAGTVVFDKTGTLTNGSFEVSNIIPAEGESRDSLLEKAACAEYYSNHPIAISLRKAAGEALSLPEAVKELAGLGIEASVKGDVILAGNAALMEKNGVAFTPLDFPGSAVYVSQNGRYLGCIVISDTIKEGAKQAISRLKELGIKKILMLTGDNEKTALSVGKALGIDEVYSRLLPQDKVELFEKLYAKKGKKESMLFVGDGINDAPVLTRADVGVAMGALGSDAAIEAADAVIMDDDPQKLALAISIARKTKRIVKQNVVFALGVKFAVLFFAAFGRTNMWVGVLADVGVAVLAILNAMRTLKN